MGGCCTTNANSAVAAQKLPKHTDVSQPPKAPAVVVHEAPQAIESPRAWPAYESVPKPSSAEAQKATHEVAEVVEAPLLAEPAPAAAEERSDDAEVEQDNDVEEESEEEPEHSTPLQQKTKNTNEDPQERVRSTGEKGVAIPDSLAVQNERGAPKKVVVNRRLANQPRGQGGPKALDNGQKALALENGQVALEDGRGATELNEQQMALMPAPVQQAPLKVVKKQESKSNMQPIAELDLLAKHYEVGRKLGEGTFGVVHECWRRTDESKTIHAVKYIDKVAQDRDVILLETSMLRDLDHPNVVKCLDVFDEPAFMCIVMQKWEGRDVVSRLIEHTENDEELPELSIAHLARQMLASLVYLHASGVIHRDVKMDNYLIDKPRLDDLGSHVALSDFGCATYLKLGDRLEESVGTKVYKSPEFIMENYNHKVDVWAVGVSMYGLLNGSLPFADETAVLQSRPLMPKGLSAPCLELLKWLLMKNEARRPHAAEAVTHAFLASVSDPVAEQRKENSFGKKNTLTKFPVRNEAVDESIVERREILMARLNMSMTRVGSMIPVSAKSFRVSIDRFGVMETRHFRWWAMEQANRKCLADLRKRGRQAAKVQPHLMDVAWTPHCISDLFQRHKVDASLYGKGSARTIDDVADEMKRGDAMLMLDGTKHSKLVRVVDTVFLEVVVEISGLTEHLRQQGKEVLVLTCSAGKGSPRRASMDLPSISQRPHETLAHATARLKQNWRLQGCEFALRHDDAACSNEPEADDRYPMVPTMRRRYVVPGTLKVTNTEGLAVLGLGQGGSLSFSCGGGSFTWCTPEQCKAQSIALQTESGALRETFSGLVRVPISFSEDMVSHVFQEYGIDTSRFGTDGAKTIANIADEVSRGESCIYEIDSKLVRVTSIVLMQIEDMATGRVLMELEKSTDEGSPKETNRLPGIKLRPQEEMTDGVGRLLTQRLKLDLHAVHLAREAAEMVEEETESDSYPGLTTLYRKFIVKAKVTTATGAQQAPDTEAAVPMPSDERAEADDVADSARGELVYDELEVQMGLESANPEQKKKKIAKKKKPKDQEGGSGVRAIKDGEAKKPKAKKKEDML